MMMEVIVMDLISLKNFSMFGMRHRFGNRMCNGADRLSTRGARSERPHIMRNRLSGYLERIQDGFLLRTPEKRSPT